MYKLLLMDADETLFDYPLSEKTAFYETFNQLGYDGDLARLKTVYSEINEQMWKMLERAEITKDALKFERFKRLFEKEDLQYDFKEVGKLYLNELAKGTHLIEGALALCEYLSKKYDIVIVTNGVKEVQHSRIGNSKVAPFIKEIIVSDDIDVSKPDVRIFEYAVEKTQYAHLAKSEILMLGDSLSADIQGGVNFGIDTCWVNLAKMVNRSEITPTFEVHHYEALKQIL